MKEENWEMGLKLIKFAYMDSALSPPPIWNKLSEEERLIAGKQWTKQAQENFQSALKLVEGNK